MKVILKINPIYLNEPKFYTTNTQPHNTRKNNYKFWAMITHTPKVWSLCGPSPMRAHHTYLKISSYEDHSLNTYESSLIKVSQLQQYMSLLYHRFIQQSLSQGLMLN
jgi:hypothetical protein